MNTVTMPWKNIIGFHRDIAVRSEESFFSFNMDKEVVSDRFSFIRDGVVEKMLVSDILDLEALYNKNILQSLDSKNTEFYIGGIFWYTNNRDKNDSEWIKYAHPLFYKAFGVELHSQGKYKLEPIQARWDISPMFFQLLDKKGIVVEGDIETIISELVEKANLICGTGSFEKTFIKLLLEKFPELKKEFINNAHGQYGPSWVAFTATKDYSAIMRMLILDYGKLLKKIQENPTEIGGFSLFEEAKIHRVTNQPIMPIVPLNDRQQEVVEKVIAGNPVTVVTGPPGCGKSQVVLSILVNAWEKGQSVLFASSNNQAVDVVRNRMKPFEASADIPMVVRCGSRKMSEIEETFQKMLASIDDIYATKRPTKSVNEIKKINVEIKELSDLLNTNLPQRIDEQSRTALGAYGKAGEYKESIELEIAQYNDRIKSLGVEADIATFENQVYSPLVNWNSQYDALVKDLGLVEDKRSELYQKIDDVGASINELLNVYYSSDSSFRKITDLGFEELNTWYKNYKEFLLEFVERDLQIIEWNVSFDTWKSSEDVKKWMKEAEAALEAVKHYRSVYGNDLDKIKEKYDHKLNTAQKLSKSGIKQLTAESFEILEKWQKIYGEYALKSKKLTYALPFSEKAKQDKQLLELESKLTAYMGPAYLGVASDSIERRKFIALYAPDMKEEYIARYEYDEIMPKILEAKKAVDEINECLDKIEVNHIRGELNKSEIEQVKSEIENKYVIAREARTAFEKRERKEAVIEKDRQLKFRGSQLIYPLFDGLKADTDISEFFSYVNNNIYNEITLEALTYARSVTYKHTVEDYLDAVKKACQLWDEMDFAQNEVLKLKPKEVYIAEWMSKCPPILQPVFSNLVFERIVSKLGQFWPEVVSIYDDWISEGKGTVEKLNNARKMELEWAWSSINKALELCPATFLPASPDTIRKNIQDFGWDVSYIRGVFAKINSQGLALRLERLKRELEDEILNRAVNKRISELRDDYAVKAAVSKLHYEYKNKGNVLLEKYEQDFETVLRALPLWLTTGQSPQSIPMLPGLFDVLIIDEATQCTITSLLPLIYRCKRIVVIGDPDQLPAIPTISAMAEQFLANRYKIEQFLHLLGHADCNIYKTVHDLVPKKEGNVMFLSDHYRSHPLIIGFANNCVYKKRLVLKKTMQEVDNNRFSGVFGKNVVGFAEKDKKTDSWCNQKEAQAVVDLILSFKNIPEYSHYSIGVITPFRGQVDLINEMLGAVTEGAEPTNVLVATVHKYQGDEKDIIIFSPVVSQGMNPGAAKWVERPHNLINVAITRAKEALYVVSDFAVCKRQQGILGDLIEYVEKIELLRKTSAYELQLFGLMVLQGWSIEVHPVIRDIEVDFIVSNNGRRVVVEVDGRQHENQKVNDANRDALLASYGLGVVRITTREVVDTPFESMERIRQEIL